MISIRKIAFTPMARRSLAAWPRCFGDVSPAVTVKDLIAKHKVLVFSKTTCSFCASVKSKLASVGIVPTVVELNELKNGAEMQNELHALTGQRTVPNVFVAGQHIGGCDVTTSLLNDGSFQLLVKNAEV